MRYKLFFPAGIGRVYRRRSINTSHCAPIRNHVMANLIFCSFSCKYNTPLRIPKFDLIVMYVRLLRPAMATAYFLKPFFIVDVLSGL